MGGKSKIPAEAVELYNRFIHGEISRRAFVNGVKGYAIAGLTASAIIDALMPNYALGQQVAKNDERIKASYETIPSPDGYGSIRGYFVRPFSADTRDATPAKLPGVIVVHENRGLNPHTEDVARRFALENFMAFAPDALTSVGGYPGDDYKGGLLFAKLDNAKRAQDFLAAARWLKARPDCTGKIGATGFCYGGGVANTLAVQMGDGLGAAAPFYGAPTSPRMWPRSRRRSSFITAASIRRWPGAIRRKPRSLRKTMSVLRAMSIRTRYMVSSMTPHRNATTGLRPSRPGRARSNGSTSMSAAPSARFPQKKKAR